MKTSPTLLLAAFAGAVVFTSTTSAQEGALRRELAPRKCRDKGKVPSDLQVFMGHTGLEEQPEMPVECTEDHITKLVKWTTKGPNGVCGSQFNFKETLGACCGGYTDENERSISVDTEFESPRMITGVTFKLEITEKNQHCCLSCKCWGDPHCAKFGARVTLDIEDRTEKIISFLACDTAVYKGPGKPCDRLTVDDAARDRCLGNAPGYEHNGNGKCIWRPDENRTGKAPFSVEKHGGPCAPSQNVRMLMFGHDIAKGVEVSTLDGKVPLRGSYEVYSHVGERGFMEGVSIEINKVVGDGDSSTNNIEEITLNGKVDCVYPKLNGVAMVPEGEQTLLNASFKTELFTITRTVSATGTGMDINFEIEDRYTGDVVQFNCRGAPDLKERSDGLQTFKELIDKQIDADLAVNGVSIYQEIKNRYVDTEFTVTEGEGDSRTTLQDKATFIDSKFFVSQFPKGITGERGFCYSGEFDYENSSQWFGEINQLLQTCPTSINLSLGDRETLKAIPDCNRILEANDCHDFVDEQENAYLYGLTDKTYRKNFNEYKSLLDKCIRVYCAKAFIPNSYSELECVTDFYDLGSKTAMETYVVDKKPRMPSNIPYMQEDCVPGVTLTYTYEKENGDLVSIEEPWQVGDGDVFLDVEGMPKQILVVQNDCAGICGTRPEIDLDVTFETVCEELGEEYTCVKKGDDPQFELCVEECV